MATALNSSALVHQPRHLLSPPAMHGFVHDQCENFSFSVFLDLCMISVRVCGMVRERADPTVPPPQPIWRDRPIHGIRHTQAESTKIPWSAIRWPKKHINVTAGLHWKRPSATNLEIVLEGLWEGLFVHLENFHCTLAHFSQRQHCTALVSPESF